MPDTPFSVLVTDLLGHTGARRREVMTGPLEIELDQLSSIGEATADVMVEAIADGLIVRGSVSADAVVRCNRCVVDIPMHAEGTVTQAYGIEGDDEILPLPTDGLIDLTDVLHDELSLAVPLAPVCKDDCQGLCPTCGTDLNTDPCGGHPEESSSPFAVLGDLFDAED